MIGERGPDIAGTDLGNGADRGIAFFIPGIKVGTLKTTRWAGVTLG
jgi:hypothetical protein